MREQIDRLTPVALRRGAFGAALAVVLFLMLRPVQEVSSSNDKIDHALVFAALMALGLWARIPWGWLFAGLSPYAVLTEVLQATATSARHGDPRDVVADLLGLAVALAIGQLVAGLRRARRASSDPVRPPG